MSPSSDNNAIFDIPDRKWGIELEILSTISRVKLKDVVKSGLSLNGFRNREVKTSQYCHDGPSNKIWKAKTDTSCGNELTSPVLSGWKGLRELQVVADAVDAYATSRNIRLIDKDCGVHVHIDCRDFSWKEIRNLSMAMKIWEPIFFAMNPLSRKDNGFCKPMKFSVIGMKQASEKDAIHDAWMNWENGENTESRRHHGFNLEGWWDRGSVEFRYFSGTWAFEKSAAAVMICLLFVHAVKQKGEIRVTNPQLMKSFDALWKETGQYGFDKSVDKFFRDFLTLRMNACPAFRELRKFVLTRVANFYQSDGTARGRRRGRS